jgi:hypothetical protein
MSMDSYRASSSRIISEAMLGSQAQLERAQRPLRNIS